MMLTVVLSAIMLLSLSTAQTVPSASNANTPGTLGNLHSENRVVQNGRWLLLREFTVDFTVQDVHSQSYCGEITTADATEAHDLMISGGQLVQVNEKGKDVYITLKDGRVIRARRLTPDKCHRTG